MAVFKIENKVSPSSIIKSLPTIQKAEVLFRSGDDTVTTPFNGFLNRFEDGSLIPVRAVKTNRYSELDHRYTFETVVRELERMKEELYVHRTSNNGDYSVVTNSIIMKKPFKLDEIPFEMNLKNRPKYALEDEDSDTFYPMITITNSFLGCSEVNFDLYRSLCANGMYMGKVLNKSIRFRHFGEIVSDFNDSVESFISSIFEKKFINKIFEEYNSQTVDKEKFAGFMGNTLGKRIEKDITEDKTFTLRNEFSAWVGLQTLTYFTTHHIKNQEKSVMAMRDYVSNLEGLR